MGIQDIATMVVGNAWNTIDAASAWDPVYANLETKKLVRTLAQGTVTSVVVMNQRYFSTYPDSPSRFMEGLRPISGIQTDTKKANDRFIKASNLSFSSESLDLATSVEPNILPNENISVTLSDVDKENIQKASDFMHSAGLLSQKLDSSTCLEINQMRVLRRILSLLIFIMGWQIIAMILESPVFPSPSQVLMAFFERISFFARECNSFI